MLLREPPPSAQPTEQVATKPDEFITEAEAPQDRWEWVTFAATTVVALALCWLLHGA